MRKELLTPNRGRARCGPSTRTLDPSSEETQAPAVTRGWVSRTGRNDTSPHRSRMLNSSESASTVAASGVVAPGSRQRQGADPGASVRERREGAGRRRWCAESLTAVPSGHAGGPVTVVRWRGCGLLGVRRVVGCRRVVGPVGGPGRVVRERAWTRVVVSAAARSRTSEVAGRVPPVAPRRRRRCLRASGGSSGRGGWSRGRPRGSMSRRTSRGGSCGGGGAGTSAPGSESRWRRWARGRSARGRSRWPLGCSGGRRRSGRAGRSAHAGHLTTRTNHCAGARSGRSRGGR